MNKNKLKQFAMESRNILIKSVRDKLMALGIKGDNNIVTPQITGNKIFVNEKEYNKNQYESLISRFKELKYEQLVESMAYTWFNRFIALRYMEQNEYIDEKIIESTTSKIDPDIMSDFRNADFYSELTNNAKDELIELKNQDNIEELYAKIVIYKCNELHEIFPFMFEKLGDYTDLLFPAGLINKDSFLVKLRENIKKDEVKNSEDEIPLNIEIIGWLYQFYNAEKKDEVFAGLNKNIKLNKNTIPVATQLFTPKWIVRYMVENSLGKLVLETSDEVKKEKLSELKNNWKYFIEKNNDSNDTNKSDEIINIEDIKIIDPAMGSGHILVYAFEILYDIYEKLGYSDRDAIKNILEKNLYGLEIDDRAGQIASFAILMKAREKYNRLFKYLKREHIELNTCAIQESDIIINNRFNMQTLEIEKLDEFKQMIYAFENAKEYGSILNISDFDIEKLKTQFEEFKNKSGHAITENIEDNRLIDLIKQTKIMQQKYDIVVTNPPYMGGSGMSVKLSEFVKKHYPDSKSDLFAVFMEKCGDMAGKDRYTAMIVMQSWMFLSSFEKLRLKLIENRMIESLVHLGYGAIGIAFGTTTFCLKNTSNNNRKGVYFRLFEKMAQNIDTEDLSVLFRMALINNNFKYNFNEYSNFKKNKNNCSCMGDEE